MGLFGGSKNSQAKSMSQTGNLYINSSGWVVGQGDAAGGGSGSYAQLIVVAGAALLWWKWRQKHKGKG